MLVDPLTPPPPPPPTPPTPPRVDAVLGVGVVEAEEEVREPGMLVVLEEPRLVEWERVGVRFEEWGG